MEIFNAKISSAFLGKEDHGIWTVHIRLKYGDGVQIFGGWPLDAPLKNGDKFIKRIGAAKGMQFIMSLCDVLDCDNWDQLTGTFVRFKRKDPLGAVDALGHYLEDKWFDPKDLFKDEVNNER